MIADVISKPVYHVLADLTQEARIEVALPLAIKEWVSLKLQETRKQLASEERRIFGMDTTGGCHVHPFDDPIRHDPLPGKVTFGDFIGEIGRYKTQGQ